MEDTFKKEFSLAVEKGIMKTLNDNPGIEKYIDWFTLLAPINEEIDKVKQDLSKEVLV